MRDQDEPGLADLLLGAPGGDLYSVPTYLLMNHVTVTSLQELEVPQQRGHWVVLHLADDELMDRVYHRGILKHLTDAATTNRVEASDLFYVLAGFPARDGLGTAFRPMRIDPARHEIPVPWPRLICINPDSTEARRLATEILRDFHGTGEMLRVYYEDEESQIEMVKYWQDFMSTTDRLDLLKRCDESPRFAFSTTPPSSVYCELDHRIRE
jgi:hypothetical protein